MEYRDLKKQYQVLKPRIDAAVEEVCTNASFIGGQPVKELEKELAEYVGVKHCITCANGTDALQLALMAWGIGTGDAVFVPDFTYFSSGEVVSAVRATPIFVDVDGRTYNIDPEKLEKAITDVEKNGKYKAKAVVAVDLFGLPANFDRIKEICKKHNLLLLEDGAQGFGGELNKEKACTFGDISTTSFFPAKPVGCYGDGGAIFTNNDEWDALLRSYAVHGKGSSKYDNIRIGMNSRLDTIQAAILRIKLDAFKKDELSNVNRVAALYTEKFNEAKAEEKGVVLPIVPDNYLSSWAQYTIQLPECFGKEGRGKLQASLKEQGIPAMIYYLKPMHQQLAFEGTDSAIADCSVTEELCNRVLSLPLDPYKKEEDISKVVTAVMSFIDNN